MIADRREFRERLLGALRNALRKELKEPVGNVVAQFLPSLFQARSLAEKNRRELKGLVERDSNGQTVRAGMKQVSRIISAWRF